jgi:hypothetical protein
VPPVVAGVRRGDVLFLAIAVALDRIHDDDEQRDRD